ncbi:MULTISPECIES: protein phosphatase 2C domain-containing protein [Microbacterium]|uniref:PP2C family protein-serine/threonine phosphatase n=1 Tax=Microbacterium TaxID=33882 RepID=UPI002859A7FF|nr:MULTISPECIES: protein phosphatase 2C domain-containing protein [Microbacterium]MDR7110531.1 protein phosphatase [Microbacterium trichothecenolyticum]MDT0142551.1 protein phosphatase 2C domain-containing protein [Microbacterium sp. PRC9]
MVFQGSSAAISHTGKVRSNNQDSGYSGSNLFVVADGMGGHAGGDVASSLAISRLEGLDRPFDSTAEAERALRDAISDAAVDLVDTVGVRPELAGMGTTVSALIMVDDYAVIAHIGDSRIYLYRDGALTQITTDHTFVQRLVDSGRITPEEARYHPRRSVLMRVLGDMDTDPELDTFIMPTQPGDRWLLCSDGLSGVVDDPHTSKALGLGLAPGRTADNLLKQALDGGAPDNVTIVIVDVGGQHPLFSGTPTIVGSASNPVGVEVPAAAPRRSSWLHPNRQAANEPTHFEPAPEFLEELIEEDRRRARRRRVGWIAGVALVLVIIAGAAWIGYQWTQTRYYVGADEDTVVIYQGVQQGIGPISLSTPYEDTEIPLDSLSDFARATVEQTISANSLSHARQIVSGISDLAGGGG